jgi:hypothetical protein
MDAIKTAGTYIDAEAEARRQKSVDETLAKLSGPAKALLHFIGNREPTRLEQQELDRISAAAGEMSHTYETARLAATMEVLQEIRPFGDLESKETGRWAFLPESAKIKGQEGPWRAVRSMARFFPTDWLAYSAMATPSLSVGVLPENSPNAGFYNPGVGHISLKHKTGPALDANTVHEMTHRFQDDVPDVFKFEGMYFASRTAGEAVVDLGIAGLRGKRDQWPDPYMGRSYGDGTHEVLTRAFEDIFVPQRHHWEDPDLRKFALGILALAGRKP